MTNGLPGVDAAFADAVQARLREVEAELLTITVGNTPFITEAASHYVAAGGKRFRPAVVVSAAYLGKDVDFYDRDPEARDRLMAAAVVMELTHVASLYHDDVMDEAELRRSAPSANKRFGNTVAIMVGDYLFARASTLVSRLGPDYVKLQADTFGRLVQGQIAETIGPAAGRDPKEHHLSVLSDKTASLISSSAVFGGKVAGLTEAQLAGLAAYGEEIGMVFQLSDDLIDIVGGNTGKVAGTDLREHVATLPTLLLRERNRPEDAGLIAMLDEDLSDDARLDEALALLRGNPVMDLARAEVARRADVARKHLSGLPKGPALDALAALCDQVVTRSS